MNLRSTSATFMPAASSLPTSGGPAYATYFYALHIYNSAFAFGEMGYGSALAVFNFVILVTLTYLNFSLSKRWVYYAGEVKQ